MWVPLQRVSPGQKESVAVPEVNLLSSCCIDRRISDDRLYEHMTLLSFHCYPDERCRASLPLLCLRVAVAVKSGASFRTDEVDHGILRVRSSQRHWRLASRPRGTSGEYANSSPLHQSITSIPVVFWQTSDRLRHVEFAQREVEMVCKNQAGRGQCQKIVRGQSLYSS